MSDNILTGYDENNSTTTPLAGGSTYTGTGVRFDQHNDVMVSVYADVSGTLYFEFSDDGTNWYSEEEAESPSGFDVGAGETVVRKANKGARYFRAKYINDAGAQSSFRLSSYYGEFGIAGATVDNHGHLDVVEHAHVDNAWIHFHSGDISASQDFILVDISDTTNYPHTNTNYAHIEYLRIEVDSDVNGAYEIEVGFLDDVDATDGNFYSVSNANGSKKAGNSKEIIYPFYPNGPRCTTGSIATSDASLNDTAFQTDVNLASTLDTGTANTPSGNGDLVVRITRNAGTIVVAIDASYHTH